MAAQQQKHQKMVEEQEDVDGMQHGPFPVEQLQVESVFWIGKPKFSACLLDSFEIASFLDF